jgi:hypothetical protein
MTITAALASETFWSTIDAHLAAVPDVDDRSRLRAHAQRSVDEFTGALTAVVDDDDRDWMIASRYVELRARWVQLNLEGNYRLVCHGSSDMTIFCEASVTAHVLATIEPHVEPDLLQRIHALLTQPITSFQ